MIPVSLKDIQDIYNCSLSTAKRKKKLYKDMMGRKTGNLFIQDLMLLDDLPAEYIAKKCPHYGSGWLKMAQYGSKRFMA
jgi:hypothetical protein